MKTTTHNQIGGSRLLVLLALITAAAVFSGCTTTDKGMAIGAGTGAAVGGLIGSTSGNAGTGALIGAGAGGVGGALAGEHLYSDEGHHHHH